MSKTDIPSSLWSVRRTKGDRVQWLALHSADPAFVCWSWIDHWCVQVLGTEEEAREAMESWEGQTQVMDVSPDDYEADHYHGWTYEYLCQHLTTAFRVERPA